MFKPLVISALLVGMFAVMPAPEAKGASIDLMPGVTLNIGERDRRGNYWDGYDWRSERWWQEHRGTIVVNVIVTVTIGMVGAGAMPDGGVRVSVTGAIMISAALIPLATLTIAGRVAVIGTDAGMSGGMGTIAMGGDRFATSG